MRELLTRGPFGVLLKDGWVGRPYDNTYQAREVLCKGEVCIVRGEGFRIEIDLPVEATSRDGILTVSGKGLVSIAQFDGTGRVEVELHSEGFIQFYLYEVKRRGIRHLWRGRKP